MSLLSTILGWFGLHREKKKPDYFDDQKDKFWYWRKDRLNVYLPYNPPTELWAAIDLWRDVVDENGPRLFLSDEVNADIVIAMEDAVAKGGVTTRVPVKGKNREIAWVKISIAKHEKGDRLFRVALHEMSHALGFTHDGAAKEDVAHPDCKARTINDRSKATYRKMRENIPEVG